MYFGQATTPSLDIRLAGPSQALVRSPSIVPTIKLRRPARLRMPSTAERALDRERRHRQMAKLRSLLSAPALRWMPLTAKTRQAAGLGFYRGLGATDDSDAIEVNQGLARALLRAQEELDSMSGIDDYRLGAQTLCSRAGDLSGALGIDVSWQDLVNNASDEFNRVYGIGGQVGDIVMNNASFEQIAAVFEDQGLGAGALAQFGTEMESIYSALSGNLNDIVGDCGLFAESGLRGLLENFMGEEGVDSWLSLDMLASVGATASNWVSAAASGEASDYLMAAGATVSAIGAGIPQPAGAVVSAVGGLISLIAAIFDLILGEPEPPPDCDPCMEDVSNKPWGLNGEAWYCLAVALCARSGDPTDSDYWKESYRRRVPVQQLIVEDGWHTTIDRYSGEIMVREPATFGVSTPYRRFLDVFDRDTLIPAADPMAVAYPIANQSRQLGAYPRCDEGWAGKNILWCQPSPNETFTRFLGAAQSEATSVKPFRFEVLEGKDISTEIGWSTIGSRNFWATYAVAAVTSMYLGGTVPYGVWRKPFGSHGYYISTGVGGFGGSVRPFGVLQATYVDGDHPHGRTDRRDSYVIRVPGEDLRSGSTEFITHAELLRRVADPAWRLSNRVPVSSPSPASATSGSIFRLAGPGFEMQVPQGLAFKRIEKGEGVSTAAKAGLVLAGITVIGGITYAIYKRRS